MPSTLSRFKEECTVVLRDAVTALFQSENADLGLEEPPSVEFGELASSIPFELAKKAKVPPIEIAKQIAARIDRRHFELILQVKPAGLGYVNFHLDYERAASDILVEAVSKDSAYGFEKAQKSKRVVVEHTSANPSGPLHLGHARNTLLGDALARILRARGYQVQTRFYVDDVGKQVAMLAYGYSLLEEPTVSGKPDQWLGLLYACVNCAVQIRTLKAEIAHFEPSQEVAEKILEVRRQLDDWMAVASDIESIDPVLFGKIVAAVQSRTEPLREVERIVSDYEKGDERTQRLVRTVADLALQGIRQTLEEVGVRFDRWDWESEFVWSGEVRNLIKKLSSSAFAIVDGQSLALDVDKIARLHGLHRDFRFADKYEVPRLTLVRRDGTTLYVARDIAYSLAKFRDANEVLNVIGAEQKLAQLQLKLALYALGEIQAARNLVHYAYGIVELPGIKMSKRRARYISFDEIIDQAIKQARGRISPLDHSMPQEDSERICRSVGLAAIKYAMLSTSSSKSITFTWDRVLSLERNSAPFINYAYTRTGGILAKAVETREEPDYAALTMPLERLLILQIGKFPEVFAESADHLRPEQIAAYANTLAEKFHEYYEKANVLRSETGELRAARLMLIRALRVVLSNSMHVLGIELSERM